MADPETTLMFEHTENGRLALFDAANDLRQLIATGLVMPMPLRMQVDAMIEALIAEADRKVPANAA